VVPTNFPTGQPRHETLPVVFAWYMPTAHLLHAALPFLLRVVYWPATQSEHADCPAVPMNLPAGHERQVEAPAAENQPARQLTQSALFRDFMTAELEPAAHVVHEVLPVSDA